MARGGGKAKGKAKKPISTPQPNGSSQPLEHQAFEDESGSNNTGVQNPDHEFHLGVAEPSLSFDLVITEENVLQQMLDQAEPSEAHADSVEHTLQRVIVMGWCDRKALPGDIQDPATVFNRRNNWEHDEEYKLSTRIMESLRAFNRNRDAFSGVSLGKPKPIGLPWTWLQSRKLGTPIALMTCYRRLLRINNQSFRSGTLLNRSLENASTLLVVVDDRRRPATGCFEISIV